MRKLRQEVNVPISTVTHDVSEIKKEYYRNKGEALVKALKKNRFYAYYTEKKEESIQLLNILIQDEGTWLQTYSKYSGT